MSLIAFITHRDLKINTYRSVILTCAFMKMQTHIFKQRMCQVCGWHILPLLKVF